MNSSSVAFTKPAGLVLFWIGRSKEKKVPRNRKSGSAIHANRGSVVLQHFQLNALEFAIARRIDERTREFRPMTATAMFGSDAESANPCAFSSDCQECGGQHAAVVAIPNRRKREVDVIVRNVQVQLLGTERYGNQIAFEDAVERRCALARRHVRKRGAAHD